MGEPARMIPTTMSLRPRCQECGKLLAVLVSKPWLIKCGRCKALNCGALEGQDVEWLAQWALVAPLHTPV